jgi:hypothetical protein
VNVAENQGLYRAQGLVATTELRGNDIKKTAVLQLNRLQHTNKVLTLNSKFGIRLLAGNGRHLWCSHPLSRSHPGKRIGMSSGSPAEVRNFFHPWSLPGSIFNEAAMNQIIYLIGLIVVIMAVLSLFGLR